MYNLGLLDDNYYRTAKPDASVLLNWSNPLTQRLCFYTNFASCSTSQGAAASLVFEQIARDTVFPSSATLVTSTRGDLGVALNFTGVTASRVEFAVGVAPCKFPGLLKVSAQFNALTVAAKFRSTTGADGDICGFNGTTGKWYLRVAGTTSAGKAAFLTLDTTTSTSAAAVNTGAWFTCFATVLPGVAQQLTTFTQNGTLNDQSAASTPSDYSGGTAVNFCIGGPTSGTNPLAADIEWVGVWNRVLTMPEMQALAGAPYQIFDPPAFKHRWLDTKLPVAGTTFVALVGGPSGHAGMSLAGVGGGLAG